MSTLVTPPRVSEGLPASPKAPAVDFGGQRIVMRGISWGLYDHLSDEIGEGQHVHLTYDGRDLEIMTTGYLHEDFKELLSRLVGPRGGAVRFSTHFEEDGRLVLQRACALGLEGIVSKVGQSAYASGRGKSWVKCKCSSRQEFVIAGYVPSTTGRKAVGSRSAPPRPTWSRRRLRPTPGSNPDGTPS